MNNHLLQSSIVETPPPLLTSETVHLQDFYESLRKPNSEESQKQVSKQNALRPVLVASLGGSDMINFQTEISHSSFDTHKKSGVKSSKDYETNIVNKFNLNEIDMKNLLQSKTNKAFTDAKTSKAQFQEYESMGNRLARLSKISEENETFSNTLLTMEAPPPSQESLNYHQSRALFKSIKQSKLEQAQFLKKSRTNFIEQNVQNVQSIKQIQRDTLRESKKKSSLRQEIRTFTKKLNQILTKKGSCNPLDRECLKEIFSILKASKSILTQITNLTSKDL